MNYLLEDTQKPTILSELARELRRKLYDTQYLARLNGKLDIRALCEALEKGNKVPHHLDLEDLAIDIAIRLAGSTMLNRQKILDSVFLS